MLLFTDYLENRLKSELPGLKSHIKMAPKVFEKSFRNLDPTPNAKKSAVLIALLGYEDPEILFTLRSSTLRSHKGQISFPGGRVEPDETTLDAALRETYEEVGIENHNIKIIGALSDLYVPPSNNLISPYVGILSETPTLRINYDEVEECFYLPISFFLSNDYYSITKEIIEGYTVDMPHWNVGSKAKLWGATSMILKELIDLYEEWIIISK